MNQAEHEELLSLMGNLLDGTLTASQSSQLKALLESSTEASDYYAALMALHAHLLVKHNLVAELGEAGKQAGATTARSDSEQSTPHAPREADHHAERDEYSAARSVSEEKRESSLTLRVGAPPRSTFRLSAIAAAVAFIAVGILAYALWPRSVAPPVVQQSPANVPAARIVSAPDAMWTAAHAPGGDTLTAGQRLILQAGSAQITFNSQARVILEGPAEFVVVDAASCRLAAGKLTAHVPAPAKGFQVHTPSGTVTDLGTEFGVYVKTGPEEQLTAGELEQPATGGPQFDGTQPPVTEVHVFRGKVELAQAPAAKSQIPNPKSKILSAGEAVTISENKVQPLPAADPFKFALDKLNGRPRTVLLSEDFEKYDVGIKQGTMGDWMIQGSTRKRQAVGIDDYDKALADWTAQGTADPSLMPAPPSISRVLTVTPSEPNPRGTFPKMARPIEAPQFAHTCQVLVEFVFFPSANPIEPSFAFAPEAGLAPGIEFWRNADPAAPPIQWKPLLVYRVRVLMDVVDGKPREARVERSQWSGSAGWVRDADFKTPVPTVDWTTPPKFVIFGYPTVTPQTPAGHFHIDNIRIEVIEGR